jgi:hypothetical protein
LSKSDRGVTVTREVLRATNELARAHGATPILVVLQFGHEEQAEQMLRRRILDDAGLPYSLIEIASTARSTLRRRPSTPSRSPELLSSAPSRKCGDRRD